MKKRLIALILACLMTAPLVTSCSNGDSQDETAPESSAADPTDAAETAEAETETTIYDDLPTGSYDGHCFNMLNVVASGRQVVVDRSFGKECTPHRRGYYRRADKRRRLQPQCRSR